MKSTLPAEFSETQMRDGVNAARMAVAQRSFDGARGIALHGRDAGDAEQLYSVLGMLIIEGRAPEQSEKGRVMGPHVKAGPLLSAGSQTPHMCDQSFNKQCLSAAFYEEELRKFGRHLIPVSVEVLLLPDCALHTSDEPSQRTPTKDQYCLLEQWVMRVLSRHGRWRLESLSAVLQAVTSYLHFSQLSAWYIQSRGTRPKHVLYRLSVPGESSLAVAAGEAYEERSFPRMPVGGSHLLELGVTALRRQSAIPALPCRQCCGAAGVKKRAAEPSPTPAPDEGWRERRSRLTLPLSESSYFRGADSPKVLCSQASGPGQGAREEAAQARARRQEAEAEAEAEAGRTPVPAKRLKFLYRQTSSEKDLTPFPRPGRSNLEAVVNEFARLNVAAARSPPAAQQPPTPRRADAEGPSRKKKREWTILFSDSSSTESLERVGPGPGLAAPLAATSSLASSRDSLESLPAEAAARPGPEAPPAPALAPSPVRFSLFDDSGADDGPEVALRPRDARRAQDARRSPSASPTPAHRRRRNANSCGNPAPAPPPGQGAGDGPAGLCPARERFLRRRSDSSTVCGPGGVVFHRRTGLPTNSSPAPLKRRSGGSGRFDFDPDMVKLKSVKSATCVSVDARSASAVASCLRSPEAGLPMSASAPATAVSSRLVVNFEESFLNGRLDPVGVVEGYSLQLAAAGSFHPKHVKLPVTSYFYKLSEDNAPSPYLGYVDLVRSLGKRGYRVPKKGTVQLTLFNPQDSVVKMFVVLYDFSDMPAQSQTFLRQRTLYMPVVAHDASPEVVQRQQRLPSYLRYIVHLRFHTTRSGKLFLHTDIRLVFPRDKFEFDPRVATYELKSFTECPHNPRYSPKK